MLCTTLRQAFLNHNITSSYAKSKEAACTNTALLIDISCHGYVQPKHGTIHEAFSMHARTHEILDFQHANIRCMEAVKLKRGTLSENALASAGTETQTLAKTFRQRPISTPRRVSRPEITMRTWIVTGADMLFRIVSKLSALTEHETAAMKRLFRWTAAQEGSLPMTTST
jgi:hypothetical protein